MKTLSPALQALFATRNFWSADLYAITLADGTTYRYTNADCNVIDVDRSIYSCGGMTGPFIDRAGSKGTISQKLGVQADTLTFDLLPGLATIQGLDFGEAATRGLWRGAVVRLRSAYAPLPVSAACWPLAITGSLPEFTAFCSEIDGSGSALTFTSKDGRSRLIAKWPRNFYAPTCDQFVGSLGCGVDPAPYEVTTVAAAGSSARTILAALSQESGHFDLGAIVFTSGANAGHSRGVRKWVAGSPGSLVLMNPLPETPAAGDAFTLHPGCDCTLGPQGCPKFGGDIETRFRGCPFVPAPTTAN